MMTHQDDLQEEAIRILDLSICSRLDASIITVHNYHYHSNSLDQEKKNYWQSQFKTAPIIRIINQTMNSSLNTSRLLLTRAEAAGRRSMSSTAKVWVDKNTRVICQGFTGKQVCLENRRI